MEEPIDTLEFKEPTKYDEEPVVYCKKCLSLRILRMGLDDLVYCDNCGGTDTGELNIKEWETLYKNKYGFKYLNNTI